MEIKGIKLNGDEIVNFENTGGGRLYRHNIKILFSDNYGNKDRPLYLLYVNNKEEAYKTKEEFVSDLPEYALFDKAYAAIVNDKSSYRTTYSSSGYVYTNKDFGKIIVLVSEATPDYNYAANQTKDVYLEKEESTQIKSFSDYVI